MAWYDITYTCGHTGRVNIIGKSDIREWRIKAEEGRCCPDCYERRLRAKNQLDAEKAKAEGLPDLVGTEKQVEWANSIRQDSMQAINEVISERENPNDPLFCMVVDEIMQKNSAKWWIDHRNLYDGRRMAYFIKERMAELKKSGITVTPEVVKTESLVRPEIAKTETVAEINTDAGKTVEVVFDEKRDETRAIFHSLSFKWNGKLWERTMDVRSGKAEDRMAEVGNALLRAGYIIRIFNEDVRQMAIDGTFELEKTRWITFDRRKNQAVIWWKEKNQKLYEAARRITRSKYDPTQYAVVVPVEFFEEIIDFAECYGFTIADEAKAAFEQQSIKVRNTLVAVPAEPAPAPQLNDSIGIPKLTIPAEVEVDESLLDKD